MSQLIDIIKLKVDAHNECIDLVRNGYVQLFAYQSEQLWVMKYRHQSNGNVASLMWKPTQWTLKINGKQVKQCSIPG